MNRIVLLSMLALVVAGCKQSPSSPEATAPLAQTSTVNIEPATTGDISGTVSFQGNAPKPALIDMTADPACPQQPQPSDSLVVNQGRLANVFVYVKEGLPAGKFPVPSEPALLDQKACRYVPHVLGTMAGQPLKIANSDAADHNVHAMPANNQPWNESQPAKDAPMMKTFARPEMMVAVQCNQHPWMKGYINVMSNPYYAVSAPDGKFEIRNLPPGVYTLVAVHEKLGEQTAKVSVEPKRSTKADFTFAAGK